MKGTNSRWGIPFHIPVTVPTPCGHTTKLTSTEFKATKESMQESTLPPEQLSILNRCFHPTGTHVEFKREEIEQSISDRFESQVRKYPDRLAVKTRTEELTYDQLNKAANRVAHSILTEIGDGQEQVGLLFEQSAAAIVAILGALKAGKIYVPLDRSLPGNRLKFILDNSNASLLLTNDRNLPSAGELIQKKSQVINIDDRDSDRLIEDPRLPTAPTSPASITYTSGATGQPKGVVHSHRNILHFSMNPANYFHICPEDRLILLSRPIRPLPSSNRSE